MKQLLIISVLLVGTALAQMPPRAFVSRREFDALKREVDDLREDLVLASSILNKHTELLETLEKRQSEKNTPRANVIDAWRDRFSGRTTRPTTTTTTLPPVPVIKSTLLSGAQVVSAANYKSTVRADNTLVGFWPLNARFGTADVTPNRNHGVVTRPLDSAAIEFKREGDFEYISFPGDRNTFVSFPQGTDQKLAVQKSFTLVALISDIKQDGPIFDYSAANQWAVHFWIENDGCLFGRVADRWRRRWVGAVEYKLTDEECTRPLQVAFSYDGETNEQKLFVNGRVVVNSTVPMLGASGLATVNDPRMGAHPSDPRALQANVACMMVYNTTLNKSDLRGSNKLCRDAQPGIEIDDNGFAFPGNFADRLENLAGEIKHEIESETEGIVKIGQKFIISSLGGAEE